MRQEPEIHDYLRHKKKFPHVWCPGCGLGIVLGAIVRAVDRLGLKKDDVAMISGIGCTGRMPVYVDFNTMHTTHGRALAFATGLKMAKPHLRVVVVMGDGDALAIGGNHFVHSCRRNIGLTAIIVDNSTYGMTGGQYSPTTPRGALATTAPYGNIEQPFPVCEIAEAAGAAYVARGTVYHAVELGRLIEKAIQRTRDRPFRGSGHQTPSWPSPGRTMRPGRRRGEDAPLGRPAGTSLTDTRQMAAGLRVPR